MIELSTLIFIVISLVFIFIITFFLYNWKLKSKNPNQTIENVEELLVKVSIILNSIENQLKNVTINSQISDTNLIKENHSYIIELAKVEIDKSMLLMEKLNNLVEHQPIDVNQLDKLSTIDYQVKVINNILSQNYTRR